MCASQIVTKPRQEETLFTILCPSLRFSLRAASHLAPLALPLQVLHDGHGIAVGPLDAAQQRGALPEARQVLVHHAHHHGEERVALGHLHLQDWRQQPAGRQQGAKQRSCRKTIAAKEPSGSAPDMMDTTSDLGLDKLIYTLLS